jgi:hypothetical protein
MRGSFRSAVGDRPWRVSSPTPRTPGDHLCWPFRHPDELSAAAREYVTEGLSRQERVAYVSEGKSADLYPGLVLRSAPSVVTRLTELVDLVAVRVDGRP